MKYLINQYLTTNYRGFELVDIPSGMGGTLPAVKAGPTSPDGSQLVICLHPEFYSNWILSVRENEISAPTYRLTQEMRDIIDSRIPEVPDFPAHLPQHWASA